MAEIKIRDISETAVSRLDEIAKSQGKSRNEFLKVQVELLAMSPELFQKDELYKALVDRACETIETNSMILQHLLDQLEI